MLPHHVFETRKFSFSARSFILRTRLHAPRNAPMKSPSAANKRCLLQAFEDDTTPQWPQDWAAQLASSRKILEPLCQSSDSSSGAERAPPPAVAAWAVLLADQIKRAKALLDRALTGTGAASTGVLQPLLELSWLQLDALHAVRRGWKSDAFLAVGSILQCSRFRFESDVQSPSMFLTSVEEKHTVSGCL